jgi:hypothetical protein
MKKTPAMLAKQMEDAMYRAGKDWLRYHNEHCTVFEKDLQYICPTNDKDRKKRLIEFAAQYGFRLRFYRQGLFAIFGKPALSAPTYSGALWPAVVSHA